MRRKQAGTGNMAESMVTPPSDHPGMNRRLGWQWAWVLEGKIEEVGANSPRYRSVVARNCLSAKTGGL